jgi:hypothetical protein
MRQFGTRATLFQHEAFEGLGQQLLVRQLVVVSDMRDSLLRTNAPVV